MAKPYEIRIQFFTDADGVPHASGMAVYNQRGEVIRWETINAVQRVQIAAVLAQKTTVLIP